MQSVAFYGIATAAILCYAIMAIIAKKVQVSVPPLTFIAITMFVLMTLATLASFTFEGTAVWKQLTRSDVWFMLLFGIINVVGFWLFLKAISGIPIAHYQLLGILTPVVTAVIAFLFLGEQVSIRFFLAIPVIFLGLWLALVK